MSNATFKAELYPNTGLSIEALNHVTNQTPGNVGVCLSGGGSRALTAGMGQLRALNYLKTSDGKSLLSQTKALSTVSGGSWLGIPFEMQSKHGIDTYLDCYADPATLTADSIKELPEGNIGQCVTSNFSVIDIAVQALLYRLFHKTPTSMLWQTVIANHILAPYDLYKTGTDKAPTQAFTYDESSKNNIVNKAHQNPALNQTPFLTLSNNQVPQYFICNTSMFVKGAEPVLGEYQYLVPVQCTPFFTGVVGKPTGVDANGKTPGGGGVTSFAFNSELQSVSCSNVSITESRPWSILDCVGASSSAFAGELVNLLVDWQKKPAKLLQIIVDRGHDNLNKIQSELHSSEYDQANAWLEDLLNKFNSNDADILNERSLGAEISNIIDSIVPRYNYWPVANATPNENIKPTMFADGGNLENTGVASLLSYKDIDNVIVFVNSPTPLSPAKNSGSVPPVITTNPETQAIVTEIVVDAQIPPLFGYQPSDNGEYLPYDLGSNISKSTAWGVHNQVFPRSEFTAFLSGVWGTAQGSKAPAIYKQTSKVLENSWFGVTPRKNLTCVWVYLNETSDWEGLLNEDVKKTLNGIDNFPNYKTLNTQLNASEVNLLSSMTAWCVGNNENKNVFIDLFKA